MGNVELFFGDALEELKKIPSESIDLVLTDPPYGLEFMGKKWDSPKELWGKKGEEGLNDLKVKKNFKVLPRFSSNNYDYDAYINFTREWASAVFLKLKAGGFLVFTMTPRQDLLWRCLSGVEQSGFELKTSGMYWLYHTGFPKAMDVSKQIMKKVGDEGKVVGKKEYSVPKADNSISARSYGISGGSLKNDVKAERLIPTVVEPTNPIAKKWFGWKSFQLKPALEVIVVAQKPRTEKTIVEQVLKTGTGAVNIEAGRIPYKTIEDKNSAKYGDVSQVQHSEQEYGFKPLGKNILSSTVGRFPANLLVEGNPLVSKSRGVGHDPKIKTIGFGKFGGGKTIKLNEEDEYFKENDDSVNRFYSLDDWAEKHGITLTQESAFFDVPKPSKKEKEEGLEGFEEILYLQSKKGLQNSVKRPDGSLRKDVKHKNHHPTVKPIKLFSYLAKLFTQPNGTILDPFMGSGTTGVSVVRMGFNFIGVEKEKDYFDIAEARINEARKQKRLV